MNRITGTSAPISLRKRRELHDYAVQKRPNMLQRIAGRIRSLGARLMNVRWGH